MRTLFDSVRCRSGHALARRVWWLPALICLLGGGERLLAQNGSTNTLTSATASDLQNALDGGGTVILNFNGTITANGAFFISTDVVLDALSNSIVISGGGGSPVFIVNDGVNFEVRNLTVSSGRNAGVNGTNGLAGSNGGNSTGGSGGSGSSGANVHGGAVYNMGTNLFVNCLFVTNTVVGGTGGNGGNGGSSAIHAGNGGNGGNGGSAGGGAIYNLNTLILSNCTFAGNSAVGGSGGAGGTNGSGPFAFSGAGGLGAAGMGAAVYNAPNANVTILACTFFGNFSEGGNSQSASGSPNNGNGQNGPTGAAARGGGIYNAGSEIMVNCTFFGNLSAGGNGGNGGNATTSFNAGLGGNGGNAYGGGVYNESTGITLVTNCTFDGGQVFGGTNGASGTGTFTNGTSSIGSGLGANIANNGGFFDLKNSILANPTNGANSSGTITDEGFNISSDNTPKLSPSTNNNLNARLSLPANNGGPTETIAIAGNSPAKDAITDNSAPPFDQRGVARPIGPFSDIGAFEFGTPQFSITGNVGTAAPGIVVFANGTNGTHSVLTDAQGNYAFTNLSAGTYTIAPPLTNGFNFIPPTQTVTVPPSTNNVNFSSSASFTLAGVISFANTPITVNLFGSTNGNNTFVTQVTSTASTGLYVFTNVAGGTYTIVPQSSAFAFVPASILVTLPPSNTNENFNAVPPTFTVSGQIANVNTNILVTATLANTTNVFSSTFSDTAGNYILANLPSGTFTISPVPTNGITFSPPNLSVTVPPSTNAQNFSASLIAPSSVSGRVSNLHQAISIMAMNGSGTNTVSTDGNGNYSFPNLAAGAYTIAPKAMSGVTFSPASINVNIPPAALSRNFSVITTSHPAIENAHVSGGQFSFAVSGTSNLVYRVQMTTNLASGVWVDISTNTAAADGTISVDSPTVNAPAVYYRVVTP